MQKTRVLKVSHGVTLTEHVLPGGGGEVARAYTVKSPLTPEVPNFGTFGEADIYFDEEILRVLNPKAPGTI